MKVTRIHSDKDVLIRRIIGVCLHHIAERGVFVDIANLSSGRPKEVTLGSISILHTSRFCRIPGLGGKDVLDVWATHNGKTRKVLSVWWEPLEVVSFKRGEWIDEILSSVP